MSAEEELEAKHLTEVRKIDLSVRTFAKLMQAVIACQAGSELSCQITESSPLMKESRLTRLLADSLTKKTLVISTLATEVENDDLDSDRVA